MLCQLQSSLGPCDLRWTPDEDASEANLKSRLGCGGLDSRDLLVEGQDVWDRAQGRDPVRVDLAVRLGIVVLPRRQPLSTIDFNSPPPRLRVRSYLDVQEVGRVLEGRHVPVQVACPAVQQRVSRADVADVALEMLHVYGLS